ncbi:hypothetical protein EON63_02240 [archaeon]|nr:MAG: hypothetical protein EON63_02240 [archaeon]
MIFTQSLRTYILGLSTQTTYTYLRVCDVPNLIEMIVAAYTMLDRCSCDRQNGGQYIVRTHIHIYIHTHSSAHIHNTYAHTSYSFVAYLYMSSTLFHCSALNPISLLCTKRLLQAH